MVSGNLAMADGVEWVERVFGGFADLKNGGGGTVAAESNGVAVSAFAAASAGRSRYDTGSHVDVSGTVLAAGVAFGIGIGRGTLTLAPFVEYGEGSCDACNSFASSAPGTGERRRAPRWRRAHGPHGLRRPRSGRGLP
jgi:hypothetical protein